MKIVDPSLFDVIKEGIEFQIPCSSAKKEDPEEELLPCMERNEGAVYWLQPKGGTVDQQEACICVNGKFYALNCKFEKAIFRSVRLTRDFQNYERLVDGTRKLVIPRRLFQEKLKTSRRVSACVLSVCVLCACAPCPVAPAGSFSRHVRGGRKRRSTWRFLCTHPARREAVCFCPRFAFSVPVRAASPLCRVCAPSSRQCPSVRPLSCHTRARPAAPVEGCHPMPAPRAAAHA